MTLIKTICPNCNALPTVKQGEHSAEIRVLAPVFKKLATELKPKPKLLRCKNIVKVTFKARILNSLNTLAEMKASAADHNIDIIGIQ